jgi:hypothetical protein
MHYTHQLVGVFVSFKWCVHLCRLAKHQISRQHWKVPGITSMLEWPV